MFVVISLEKDLYDQALVYGKIASIYRASPLANERIEVQIKMNNQELEFVKQTFTMTSHRLLQSVRPFENALETLRALCDWLQSHMHDCFQVKFIHEELCLLVEAAERRLHALKELNQN